MDETTVSLHPYLARCWMKRGEQTTIPAAGKQQVCHLFGAYNWVTDKVIWLSAETKNSDSFILFMEHFMKQQVDDKPIVLVLDNASYHHSYRSEATLAFFEEDGLLTVWLPPYSPHLNPIERYWRHLKSLVANKLFTGIDSLLSAVESCLHFQNQSPDHFSFLIT